MTHSFALDTQAISILDAALDIADAAERRAFVTARCADNTALAAKVERMLAMEQTGFRLLPTESFTTSLDLFDSSPERIGVFRVTGTLGCGGMGLVVKAERDDGLFEQVVAIKIIRRGLTDARSRERFAAERQILGRLIHPSIARILDGGDAEGRPYLVMDFVDGLPVTNALNAQGATLVDRLDAFETICEAVAHAHRNLVVHADIKPSNVLMCADGTVKLLDFGIAKLMVDLDADEVGDPYPLTRGYASPERAKGAPPTIVGDVYGLGALLHEILTGQLPESEQRASETRPVGPIRPEALRGDLDALIAKATADDPSERYPDVASLLSDIRAYRASQPLAARHNVRWHYYAVKFARRHAQGLSFTATIIAILTTTTVLSSMLYFSAERARTEASARFDDARGTARFLLFDLMDRLQNQPGGLPLREKVADVAQHYLDRLTYAHESSPGVRLESATGLWRLAEQQAKPGYPSLGLVQNADANLAKADTIVETLGGASAEVLAAHIALDRVQLATDMNTDTKQADALLRMAQARVLNAQDHDPGLRADLLLTQAALWNWEGKYASARASAQSGLALTPPPDTRDALLARVRLSNIVADTIYYQGQTRAAASAYAEVVKLIEEAQKKWPSDNFVRTQLARARWNLATTLMQLKRPQAALPLLAAATAGAKQALDFDASDQENVRNLRIIGSAYAQDLSMLGLHDKAHALIAARVEADRTMTVADPQNVRKRRDYGYSLLLLGEAGQRAHRYAEACAADRRAIALYDSLRRRGHLTPWDDEGNIKTARERDALVCR